MRTYDLYGSRSDSLSEMCMALASVLGVTFELHDSDYMGGDYYVAGSLAGEHFIVCKNVIRNCDDMPEPDYPEFTIIVEVNANERPDDVRQLLARIEGLQFLHRLEC